MNVDISLGIVSVILSISCRLSASKVYLLEIGMWSFVLPNYTHGLCMHVCIYIELYINIQFNVLVLV